MGAWTRWGGGLAALALAAACGRRPDAATAEFDVAAEFAKVTAAEATLAAVRQRLDRVAAPAEGQAGSRDVEAAYDAAYASEQAALAGFLNRALNLAPARPETRQALALYADAAVANASFLTRNGGDGRQALPALTAAERAYRALGLSPPAALAAALAAADRAPAPPPTPTATPATRKAPRNRRRSRR